MITFRRVTSEDLAATRRELVQQFPSAKFGWPPDVKSSLLDMLLVALRAGSEEAIQKVLTANPYLIQYAVKGSGHQGIWVFPKAMIKPRGADGTRGLVPDFLIATRSSLGYYWHVVELKRFDVQFANRAGDGYSAEGNKAIAQCNAYLDHFQNYIDAVRSNVHVSELVQPEGAILLIGDSERESDAQRQCRSNYVGNNSKIDVVSYRRIISRLRSDLEVRQRR
ncbi:Shedu anti-phage system protein SduA domain-containing protein [Reyranella sp.]|uniref:Shedu anti-phage system protein SduA domain-containing protein n=1 Tax=Reyranella sp. TaxID=1929291 RepID=UPI003BAB9CC5